MRNLILISFFPTLQMHSMFYNAVAFNQDLCHFGDYFKPDLNLDTIFWNSGCSNKNVPTSAAGPWCAVTNCPEY